MASSMPTPLSALDKSSFAYKTVKDRLPVIVAKTIDSITRTKEIISKSLKTDNDSEKDISSNLKAAVGELSQLRHEIMTNKPLLQLNDEFIDANMWNELINSSSTTGVVHWDLVIEKPLKWFSAPWLIVECYMYRRMHSAFLKRQNISNFDHFSIQKEDSTRNSALSITEMISHMKDIGERIKSADLFDPEIENDFCHMLQLCLWGNKCDMSLSGGDTVNHQVNPLDQVDRFYQKIIVNDMEIIWKALKSIAIKREEKGKKVRVDIVLDNAGFELFVDFCLADFLIMSGLADEVFFHCKCIPWFVSDTVRNDFYWLIEQSEQMCAIITAEEIAARQPVISPETPPSSRNSPKTAKTTPKTTPVVSPEVVIEEEEVDSKIALRNKRITEDPAAVWSDRLKDGFWFLVEHEFWTSPFDYNEMPKRAPELYQTLKSSDLIIFKGDLNYRKLVGDIAWKPTTPFKTAIRDFHPAPLVALRTLKADVIVGLDATQLGNIKRSLRTG